mmetsp:Transcript_148001/g.258645  ORF Transcript_148001/g.258645 Transcript_148001/m.258645 type:complete len:226 (-) Transcript_148001:2166-2843(-)
MSSARSSSIPRSSTSQSPPASRPSSRTTSSPSSPSSLFFSLPSKSSSKSHPPPPPMSASSSSPNSSSISKLLFLPSMARTKKLFSAGSMGQLSMTQEDSGTDNASRASVSASCSSNCVAMASSSPSSSSSPSALGGFKDFFRASRSSSAFSGMSWDSATLYANAYWPDSSRTWMRASTSPRKRAYWNRAFKSSRFMGSFKYLLIFSLFPVSRYRKSNLSMSLVIW